MTLNTWAVDLGGPLDTQLEICPAILSWLLHLYAKSLYTLHLHCMIILYIYKDGLAVRDTS